MSIDYSHVGATQARATIRKYAPGTSDFVSLPLTNMAVAYMLSTDAFVAPLISPVTPVPHRKGSFYKFPKGNWFRQNAQVRVPNSASAGGDYSLTTGTFECNIWALHKDTPWDVRDDAPVPLRLQEADARFCMQGIMLAWEKKVLDTLMQQSFWTTDFAGAAATNEGAKQFKYWSQSGSTPVKDGLFLRQQIINNTGKIPNVAVIGPDVFLRLQDNADVFARYPGNPHISIDATQLAMLWNVEKVIVANVPQNTAAEGQTDAMSPICGKHMWMGYVAPEPQINEPTAIMTPVWDGLAGAVRGVATSVIERMEYRSTRTECMMPFDVVAPAVDCGAIAYGITE